MLLILGLKIDLKFKIGKKKNKTLLKLPKLRKRLLEDIGNLIDFLERGSKEVTLEWG
jgi:hypothetical protein